MISFKSFLLESQNYPLYHGTILDFMANMIMKNEIGTGYEDPYHWPSKSGEIISTSRSFKFAKEWAQQLDNSNWVVIELDRAKLKNNYKIVPFNYFGNDETDVSPKTRWTPSSASDYGVNRNQFEEAITKAIKPALKYIKAIHMSPETRKIFLKRYPKAFDILAINGRIDF